MFLAVATVHFIQYVKFHMIQPNMITGISRDNVVIGITRQPSKTPGMIIFIVQTRKCEIPASMYCILDYSLFVSFVTNICNVS